MRITYDAEADAVYFRFQKTNVTTTQVAEGIAVDFDALGKIAGIEILDAKRRFGNRSALRGVRIHNIGVSRK